ncbi:MAG: hypothetical protein HY738_24250 [Bacteroidia bacterium]|nr:hypothetical protein [Bacteroidia bacterium]
MILEELGKEALEKAKTNKEEFTQELKNYLVCIKDRDELEDFKKWCTKKFGNLHSEILNTEFERHLLHIG